MVNATIKEKLMDKEILGTPRKPEHLDNSLVFHLEVKVFTKKVIHPNIKGSFIHHCKHLRLVMVHQLFSRGH